MDLNFEFFILFNLTKGTCTQKTVRQQLGMPPKKIEKKKFIVLFFSGTGRALGWA